MSGTQVVCPIAAAFMADGTANLNQVMQETVDPYTANFDLYLSHASANNVFKAFSVADGVSDASADIVVTVATGVDADVKAALKYALENALGGAGATDGTGGDILKLLMEAAVKGDVEAELSNTGLFNILEAESLLNVDISNSLIGTAGSEAMWAALEEASPAPGLSNPMLNVIATQLPYNQYVSIDNGGNLDDAFVVGDTLVFHFTIQTKLAITAVNQDVTGAQGSDAGVPAQGAFESNTHSRTFNLHITKVA